MPIMIDPLLDPKEQDRLDREARLAQYPYTPTMEDMVDDEVRAGFGLPPRPRPPLAGIRDMDNRIMELTQDKAKLLCVLDDCDEASRPEFEAALDKLNSELETAKARLIQYKKEWFEK